ncbi:uncharacterized protein LOC128813786 isoform X2 [Vidua macroura]|uniref:uncharacterized protein LOC128813786 isoform X2 n=1 Tax=Vidua macroura TaxID=187451 RepID=UPI0023A7E2DB|nr:uncharacterized protein LOC128813786 isoform X2 [Vidua macroura]
MALALRLFLPLLLAVALPARAAQAAPLQARGAGWIAGNVFPAPWLEENLDPVGPPTGVSAEWNFLAPGLDAVHKPSAHRRGETQAKGENKSLKPSEILDQMLSDLERRREMKGEPVHKEAFPRGSSDSVPAPAAGREAMPGTVTGDWDREMDDLEILAHNHFKSLEDVGDNPVGEGDADSQPLSRTEPLGSRNDPLGDAEDAASTTAPVPDSQKGIGRGFCHGTGYWLGLMAGMLLLELVFMLCCFRIWYSWKRKRRSSGQEMKGGGFPSHPDCLWSTSSSNKGLVSPFWSSEKRTPVDLSTRKSPKTL